MNFDAMEFNLKTLIMLYSAVSHTLADGEKEFRITLEGLDPKAADISDIMKLGDSVGDMAEYEGLRANLKAMIDNQLKTIE